MKQTERTAALCKQKLGRLWERKTNESAKARKRRGAVETNYFIGK